MSTAAKSSINPFSSAALAAKALEKLGSDAPTTDSILRVAAYLAELVNKAPGLHGAEKTALVQQVLRDIISVPAVRAKLNDDTFNSLTIAIDMIVPTALALIISAGRGELDLRKPATIWKWCCDAASVSVSAPAAAPAAAAPASAVDTVTEVMAVAVPLPLVTPPVTPPVAPPVATDVSVSVSEKEPVAANNAPTESMNPTPAP
jgi:hypothetical protein